MKPFLLVLSVALIAFISLSARAMPPCIAREESFGLRPIDATFNGHLASRSTTTGRLVTDAGVEFDQELAQATAVLDQRSRACPQQAGEVTLNLIEPFSGARLTLQLVPP